MGTMIHSVRNALIGALSVILLFLAAGPAAAHSGVVSSNPDNGAQLDRSPGTVSLTFNEDVRSEYATLRVIGPDNRFWDEGEPTVDGATVSVQVGELGPAGEYLVNYRITSADGHPVQGQRTFTLTVAASGTPGPTASAADRVDPGEGDGFPVWAIVLLVVVALLALGIVPTVLLARRRGA